MWWFVGTAIAAEPCDGIDNDGNGTTDDAAASIGSAEFATLGDAVDAAHDGDVVLVCSTRTHFADLVLGDRTITLQSVGPFGPATISGAQDVSGTEHVTMVGLHLMNPPDPQTPGEPALLVGEKGWVDLVQVTVDGADPGVEVRGALGATGSRFGTSPVTSSSATAVLVQPHGTAALGDSQVSGNPTGVVLRGGMLAGGVVRDNQTGVLVQDAVAVIAASVVTKNAFDGIDSVASTLTLNDVTVTDNSGTGVYLFAGDPGKEDLTGEAIVGYSTIADNRRGGIRTEVPLDLLDTTVSGNTGGGIATTADIHASASNVTDNYANRGAGLLVLAPVTVSGLRIAGNTALVEGGGVVVDVAEGVTRLEQVLVVDNEAGAQAGGLLVRGDTQVSGSAVHRNQALLAGGALLSGKHVLTSQCSSWGIRTDDNTVDDVVTDAGPWSIGTDDFRCDSGGCLLSVALCQDPGGDVLDAK